MVAYARLYRVKLGILHGRCSRNLGLNPLKEESSRRSAGTLRGM